MLRRLCPVPSVRAAAATEGAGAAQQPSLSAQLAEGTRDVHDASDALIRSKAPLAFGDPAVWAALLSQFFHVFFSIEAALSKAAATDKRVAALHHAFFARLTRTDAFLADVAYHSGGRPPSPPLPATKEYAARLSALASSEPLLVVTYAQTMYIALLAGGKVLARMLRAARALPPGQGGTAIFDFDAVLPASEQRRFRQALSSALDDLGGKLAGTVTQLCNGALWHCVAQRLFTDPSSLPRLSLLAAKERTAMLSEKRAIFARNDAVIRAVLGSASGSVLRAWIRILLSALSLPRIYVAHGARTGLQRLRSAWPWLWLLALLFAFLAAFAAPQMVH